MYLGMPSNYSDRERNYRPCRTSRSFRASGEVSPVLRSLPRRIDTHSELCPRLNRVRRLQHDVSVDVFKEMVVRGCAIGGNMAVRAATLMRAHFGLIDGEQGHDEVVPFEIDPGS